MRQLFVPACLCLMTFTGSTSEDSKLSLEQFTGASVAKAAGQSDKTPTSEAAPGFTKKAAAETTGSEPYAIADIPIDIPQTDVTALIKAELDAAEKDAKTATATAVTPLPKAKPEIKPVIWRSREEICTTLTKAAHENNLPAPFFIKLLFQESRFQAAAVSPVGAQGIAQFMPETADRMGLDNPFDPLQAIPASARLLRNLFQQFGNLGLAAAAYNAGPKRIQDWLTKKGVLPKETQGYVATITGRPAETWRTATTGTPASKLPRLAPCQESAGLLAWNGPDEIPVPTTAPHRRVAEPILVADNNKPAKKAHGAQRGKTAIASAEPIIIKPEKAGKHDGKRKTAVIDVAAKPAQSGKKADPHGKTALQLAAARKHDSKTRKVRVSSAK